MRHFMEGNLIPYNFICKTDTCDAMDVGFLMLRNINKGAKPHKLHS